jgi:hypothetical protein
MRAYLSLLLPTAAVMILVALEITYLLAGDTQEFLGFQATAAAVNCPAASHPGRSELSSDSSELLRKSSELPSHKHLFGHHDMQLLHRIVIQAKSSFNIFLNIFSSSYVSRY